MRSGSARRLATRLVIVAVIAVTAIWLWVSFVALSHLRARQRPPFEDTLPGDVALGVEDVRLRTADGEELDAWYLDATRDDAPNVIELHGINGTRRARLGAAQVVRERGCAVLLVTLRAHGDSTGESLDFGWSSRHDVAAAVDWVRARRPGRGVLVHASSMGAASAVFAAPELGDRVAGYALECLYLDLDSAARSRCELALPPVLDVVAWLGLRTAAAISWPEYRSIAPIDWIERIPSQASILLLAGGRDEHIRAADMRALHERVRERAKLVVIESAMHDRLQSAEPEAYRRAVHEWIGSH